jgi:hypothetical protein
MSMGRGRGPTRSSVCCFAAQAIPRRDSEAWGDHFWQVCAPAPAGLVAIGAGKRYHPSVGVGLASRSLLNSSGRAITPISVGGAM